MYEQGIEVGGIDFFASRGYIVVVVNPRGIQNSEGIWTGVLSRQDQIDCCEVIRWAGHYLSDGNVGMIGCGYAGKIQPLVASMNPPYLKAIMPIDVIDDMYLDCCPGGILSDINYPLCSYIPHTNTISEAEMEHSEEELKEMLAEARRQPEIATNSYYYRGLDSFPPRHYTWNIDIMLHPFKSEWWDRRSFKDRVVSIPTYIVGLYYEYGYATISSYDIYNKIDNSVPKKLLMLDPATAKTSPYEKPVPEQLRWYDHWLKGMDTGIMDEPPIKMLAPGRVFRSDSDATHSPDVPSDGRSCCGNRYGRNPSYYNGTFKVRKFNPFYSVYDYIGLYLWYCRNDCYRTGQGLFGTDIYIFTGGNHRQG